MHLIKSLTIIALIIIPTFSYSADWRELDTVINYDTGKTDYVLDIDNLKSNIITSGNIGVGTTLPAYNLQVVGTLDATTITENGTPLTNYWSRTAPNIYPATITDNTGLGTTAPLALLQVGTIPNPGLFVTSAGNVGIGKTSPAQRLDVAGTIAGTTITGANVTSGADPGHTHGSGSITEVDPNAILTNGTRGLSGNWDNGDFDISTIGNIGVGNTNPLVLLDAGSSPSVGLKVLANGNVGIGTTTPIHKLDVAGTGSFTGNVGIGASSSATYALYVSGDSYVTGDSYQGDQYKVIGDMGALGNVGAGTTAPIYRLDVRGSGNAILNMTGNVGIGTTNPTQKLDVIGNIRSSGTGTFNILSITNLIDISSQTNLSGDTENVLTGDALSIASAITRDTEWNGLDFLVGTATGSLSAEIVAGTAPGGELGGTWASPTIDDSLAVTSWTLTTPILSGIFNTDNNWLSGDGGAEGLMIDDDGNVGIGTTAPLGLLQVGTSPSPGLLVTAGGSLGIGTTAPDSPLHIIGVAQQLHLQRTLSGGSVYQTFQTTGSSAYIGIESSSGGAIVSGSLGGALVLGSSSSKATQFFTGNVIRTTIDTSGNVGIGTTGPLGLLQVGTSPAPGLFVTSGGNVGIGTSAPLGLLQVGSSPTPGLIVLSNGNIGIGVTNPAYKLEVKGAIKSSDTEPYLKLNIIGTTVSTLPGAYLHMQKNINIEKIEAQSRGVGATNCIFTLMEFSSDGTTPLYNLVAGQTAGTTKLTIASAGITGKSVPAGNLIVPIITAVNGGATAPDMRLQIDGVEY